MKRLLILFMFLFIGATMFSQTRQRESYYQQEFANVINGETEVRLDDGTRADIVTENYAIEVDFASKWAESGFQSLHYAEALDKKAGILLVWEGEKEIRYLERLLDVIVKQGLPITVWVWNWTDDTWSRVDYKVTYLY